MEFCIYSFLLKRYIILSEEKGTFERVIEGNKKKETGACGVSLKQNAFVELSFPCVHYFWAQNSKIQFNNFFCY